MPTISDVLMGVVFLVVEDEFPVCCCTQDTTNTDIRIRSKATNILFVFFIIRKPFRKACVKHLLFLFILDGKIPFLTDWGIIYLTILLFANSSRLYCIGVFPMIFLKLLDIYFTSENPSCCEI